MAERLPINFKGSDICGFEGVGKRPLDCKNNPIRYPDNYRPGICIQCPTDDNINQIAKDKLPVQYILFKQGKANLPSGK